MNVAFFEAGEFLPQPPPDVAAGMTQRQIHALSLENLLAATNGELKCALILSTGPEPETVPEVRDRFAENFDRSTGIPFPDLTKIRDKFSGNLGFGIVDYDKSNDTVALVEGSESAIAFSSLLLAASLESSVPIAKVSPLTVEYSWESYKNLPHLKRLLTVMRIVKSGTGGVCIKRVNQDLDGDGPTHRVIHQMTHTLTSESYMKINKEKVDGHRVNMVSANPRLRDMSSSILTALTLMYFDPKELRVRADVAKERVLDPRTLPFLYKRSIINSRKSRGSHSYDMSTRFAEEIAISPNGYLTSMDAFEIFGKSEGYKNRESFMNAVERGELCSPTPLLEPFIAVDEDGKKIKAWRRTKEPSRRHY